MTCRLCRYERMTANRQRTSSAYYHSCGNSKVSRNHLCPRTPLLINSDDRPSQQKDPSNFHLSVSFHPTIIITTTTISGCQCHWAPAKYNQHTHICHRFRTSEKVRIQNASHVNNKQHFRRSHPRSTCSTRHDTMYVFASGTNGQIAHVCTIMCTFRLHRTRPRTTTMK